ncbi:aminomethyl-transferring glycine dehydrogenase subunit GcvPA [Natranaerobius thermophilus]|uniref:Probable glycine dehydrogenase (decarboxylating) subunit 1 n=1 Tax=Natranaerobius thermophilus (strain ATCC BAA-1301 / DSM 18059 / JW/NM-WN-LF) TaxID=457570 RepID=B2A2T2_NATTJ|nr:aminomethyl-transferring glycine dehydrogenase subunit GcvPA [Natranaerobius thermophilus]ACB86300.1 glycine dehydrogenase (decarboxylating) alpha subunit [Natranaerobius thermophilus JW/NM-WN-LF]
MNNNYLPHTDNERREMLEAIGVDSVRELFKDIPKDVLLDRDLDLPPSLSEPELIKHMQDLADKNEDLTEYTPFLGAGVYDHYIPSAIGHILKRSEFYTAYTPYQAEASQGTLQTIFEYQTMISELTGMEVANASMYDGATSVAEAALMSLKAAKGNTVLVSETVNPSYRQVLRTYVENQGFEVKTIPQDGGVTNKTEIENALSKDVACYIAQTPNFFGNLEQLEGIKDKLKEHKAMFVVCADPISLGLIKPPAEHGADIVVGDGQSLGNPMNMGGPLLGFFASTKKLIRKMPGRIIGETTDTEGNRGFVLNLQTREQHIRREKATSNICSNQALNALAACVYLTLMGPQGLKQVANLSLQKANYAKEKITELDGYELAFDRPFFKEFVIKTPKPVSEINEQLLDRKIVGGLDLGRFYSGLENHMLICVTEKRTKEEIDNLVLGLEGIK